MTTTGVLVVGGGPAGLSAAIAAAGHGAATLLVDEGQMPGGQLTYRLADGARETGARLRAEASRAGVTIESRAVVWGLFAGSVAAISQNRESRNVHFERVILATGSTDRVVSFAGSSLPGVFTVRALQILMHRHRVLVGQRFAVIGGDANEICMDIEASGGTIVVRDAGDRPERLTASGTGGVERLTIDGVEYDVDAIALAFGHVPDPRLAIMAECAVEPGATPGAFVPWRDESLRTTNPPIFAAGDICGSGTITSMVAEGRLAGIGAAASLGLVSKEDLEAEQRRFAEEAPERLRAAEAGQFVQFAGQGEWR